MKFHIDFDSFFASCEISRNPDLKGKPVIVGNGKRSVVSAASYEAREFGVHSAMPIFEAKKLCPDGIYLPVDMEYYIKMSNSAFNIISDYVVEIEKIGLDEAYINPLPALKIYNSMIDLAFEICKAIETRLKINCSIGIGKSKSIAKIASNYAKPKGVLLIKENDEIAFLNKLPAKAMWGIGRASIKKLESYGVETIGDLSKLPKKTIELIFGNKNGNMIWDHINGFDEREIIIEDRLPKSIGRERTLKSNTREESILTSVLMSESRLVAKHLREQNLVSKNISVSIVTADRIRHSISKTLDVGTDVGMNLYDEAKKMLIDFLNSDSRDIRLIGIYASKLIDAKSIENVSILIPPQTEKEIKHRKAEQIMSKFENEFNRIKWK